MIENEELDKGRHPDDGSIDIFQVLTFLTIVFMIVVSGWVIRGSYINLQIAGEARQETRDLIAEMESNADVENHANSCVSKVKEISSNAKNTQFKVVMDETLEKDSHRVIVSMDESFDTEQTMEFLKCVVDRKGNITEIDEITLSELNSFVDSYKISQRENNLAKVAEKEK